MAATDQAYRNQRMLDVVFGVSCVLMLASIVWMFYQDYHRPFKEEQRNFRDVEEGLAERQMLKLVPDQKQIKQINETEAQLAAAQKNRDDQAAELKKKIRSLVVHKEEAEADAKAIKADLDSISSLYDIAVEHRNAGTPGTARYKTLKKVADDLFARVNDLKDKNGKAQDKVDKYTQEIEDAKQNQKKLDNQVAAIEDRLKKLTADFERFAKLIVQKHWKVGDWVRSLPVLDAFNSPTRIQQYTLDQLPIDYNFKYVTRFDRCTTCHLGMDQPTYTKEALRALGRKPSPALLAWLKREADQKPPKELQKEWTQWQNDPAQGQPPEGLMQWFREQLEKGLPEDLQNEDLADDALRLRNARLLLKMRQVALKEKNPISPEQVHWVTVKLSDPQVNEYCVHPRLDLFVDEKSAHPAEKFGCTICHGGQGSATDFQLATHTPNNSLTMNRWVAKHHWQENRDWEFPMLPSRFVESSCIQCHYQVVDLLPQGDLFEFRQGKPVETPGAKVVRGYNIVREMGCFGCHEIAGIKDGRLVGPDLRLEPVPALEELTPAERRKLTADPLNPPGTMRKIGPSLRRLSEKTNEEWARKWIAQPRGFRPETKMPHFYNLSNNNPEALKGTGQEGFAEAEIYAIAFYLFRESEAYLQGDEISNRIDRIREEELQDKKKQGLLSDKDKVDLEEVTQQLQLAARQKPVPIAERLTAEDGSVVQLPPAPKDDKGRSEQIKRGRQLFTERGCLACHAHNGTTTPLGDLPAVDSQAHFGPDLSRLAAKLGPEHGDADARRRWLVQWILNPKIHSPRTRMPVTHLNVEEAADVAAWLLSQKADWKEPDLAAPKADVLEKLAGVYLKKSMTRSQADELLQAHGLSAEKIKDKRRENPEADELRLDATKKDESWSDKLKWYIGRKAINNLGCFGCHDIPGFETAKPIGTPLNDWGKKDPERLAFEDVTAFVAKNYHLVDSLVDDKGNGIGPDEDGKPAFERYFMHALQRRQRDGFLNQKLIEPRSYDYDRLRAWDDRLRMPQFRLRQGKAAPHKGESQAQADARAEAEVREAVMTFILGLVAEPIPLQYVYEPPPERLAEIKGIQILDKYNCAGCHQLRHGIYEFNTQKPSKVLEVLDAKYQQITDPSNLPFQADLPFPNHNAWDGRPSKQPERVLAYAVPQFKDPRRPDSDDPAVRNLHIRLTEALRYTKEKKDIRDPSDNTELPPGTYDIPAGEELILPKEARLFQADKNGGTFGDLMVPYLIERNPTMYKKPLDDYQESPDARAAVPPPLLREGEKTQPAWLFQFLRNPYKIRPATILRMPRFSLSDDEAMTLVNYFAAVDKMENPGVTLNAPYLAIPQRNDDFLSNRSREYLDRLGPQKVQERIQEFHQKPWRNEPSIWEQMLRDKTDQLKEEVAAARKTLQAATGPDRAKAQKDYDTLKKDLDILMDKTGKHAKEQEAIVLGPWQRNEIYATDAYRLLANKDICFKCHQVGILIPDQAIGPPLNEAPQRLRPEWTRRWIASPQRLLIYPIGQHPMPQAFPRNEKNKYNEIFAGTPLDRATALRDILMIYPKVADMPANRYYRPGQGGSP